MLWLSTISKYRNLILAALLVVVVAVITAHVVQPRTVKEKRTVAVATKDTTATATVNKEEQVTSVTAVTSASDIVAHGASTRTGTTTKRIKVIEKDPATGNVVRETETTEETGLSEQGSTDSHQTTNIQTVAQTSTSSATEAATSTQTHETEKVDTTEVEHPVDDKSSRLGVAVTSQLRPMLTYDVKRVGPLAFAGALEVDLARQKPSGAGLAGLLDLDRDGRKFAGVYGQYKFKEKTTEIGVTAGIRF